jgi:16S rRNA (cytidine1402-2'-O)-methyltransferase
VTATLVLVATPIGNLGDITHRAVRELGAADAIACEDTRRTRALLSHLEIRCPDLIVVNDHTEAAAARDVLRRLALGQRLAVVTDAGTPGISDPGERLVRAAVRAGYPVEIAPGPSAAIAALVISGLPTGRFVFEGFLPRKGSARSVRLDALRHETRTAILYEAPHRVRATLADLVDALGPEREVAVARELSKLHEEVWRGSLAGALTWAEAERAGEFVLVLAGASPADGPTDDDIVASLRAALGVGLSKRDAVAAVTAELAVGKRRVYDLATRLVE